MMQVAYYGSQLMTVLVYCYPINPHHWDVKYDVSHMGIERQSTDMGML